VEPYSKIVDLRDVPLTDKDFNILRGIYGARKTGTGFYAVYMHYSAAPNYRLAAQIDLDRFHDGEEHFLDWDELLAEMFPEPDERTPQERRDDAYADTLEKG
jgi:hypothetical protein